MRELEIKNTQEAENQAGTLKIYTYMYIKLHQKAKDVYQVSSIKRYMSKSGKNEGSFLPPLPHSSFFKSLRKRNALLIIILLNLVSNDPSGLARLVSLMLDRNLGQPS